MYCALYVTAMFFCAFWILFGCLVVRSSAVDCLESLVSRMTCYMMSEVLMSTYLFIGLVWCYKCYSTLPVHFLATGMRCGFVRFNCLGFSWLYIWFDSAIATDWLTDYSVKTGQEDGMFWLLNPYNKPSYVGIHRLCIDRMSYLIHQQPTTFLVWRS